MSTTGCHLRGKFLGRMVEGAFPAVRSGKENRITGGAYPVAKSHLNGLRVERDLKTDKT